MTHEQMEDLPPDVRALLDAERSGRRMPEPVRERLGARVAAIPFVIPAGWPSATTAAPRSMGRRLAHLLGHRLSVAAVSLGVGGGVGAKIEAVAIHRSTRPPAAVQAPVAAAAVPAPVPVPVATPEAPAERTADKSPRRDRPRERVQAPDVPAPAPSTLAAERTLLETARTALTRGNASEALDALSRHERLFAHGELAEERESLRVQALLLAGRREEARAAAQRFEAKYPKSLSIAAVRASLSESP